MMWYRSKQELDKVSGNCMINGGDSSEGVYIELCEASNYTNMITCAVRDKYAVYVPTGKYRCSVRNLEGSLADENITVNRYGTGKEL